MLRLLPSRVLVREGEANAIGELGDWVISLIDKGSKSKMGSYGSRRRRRGETSDRRRTRRRAAGAVE